MLLLFAHTPSGAAANLSRAVETPALLYTADNPPEGIAAAGWQSILRQFAAANFEAIDPLISTQVKKLTPADAALGDQFGFSVSVSGNTAVVGAYQDDGATENTGSAYVFERNIGGVDNWGLVKKLTASDAGANDEFGISVSISGDTVVVGAHRDNTPASDEGSAYVFSRNAGGANNWGEVKKLTASDGGPGDKLGYSVSISGDTVVVGAHLDNVSDSGSAYVFSRNAGGANNWGEVKKLTAADSANGDRLGTSVSICGDTVVVGSILGRVAAQTAGSAYVFSRNSGGVNNWGQVKKLIAADAALGDRFGISVSISGDTAVVGAHWDDDAGSASGSAYVFGRNAGGADNWGQVMKVTGAETIAGDEFGFSVSISEDTLVIGARFDDDAGGPTAGSAYVFERNTGGADNWGQVTKLFAADAAAGDWFGHSASISGDTVVVGAPNDAAPLSGSAYIFTIAGCDWHEVAKPVAPEVVEDDQFGFSVSIDEDTSIVGAFMDDAVAAPDSGSAYVFRRNVGGADNWGRVKKLTSSDESSSDQFGYSVSISGDTAVVGARRDKNAGSNSGAAYVFERNAGGAEAWGQVEKLIPADPAFDGEFGTAVSISGNTVVVGDPFDDDSGPLSGSAYVFERDAGGASNWGQVKKLTCADPAAGDFFGTSVSISGDTIAVGAKGDEDGSGSAYVFERNAGGANNWGQVKKLTAADAAQFDDFGYSVSLNGATVVLGAPRDDDAGSESGSAYVFERNAGGADNWGQVKKLTAADAAPSDRFGHSVSIKGDKAVVGAVLDAPSPPIVGARAGSAYLFERNTAGADNWGQVTRLGAADGSGKDEFGVSVSVSGETVVVGAQHDDDRGGSSGSSYVFESTCTGVPGEASPDGSMQAWLVGSNIYVTFAQACSAIEHAAYWGFGPIQGSVQWVGSACGFGNTGIAAFDPGPLLPGQWLYFVIVGYNSEGEGGYGVSSTSAERPEAAGIGACDRPIGPPNCP